MKVLGYDNSERMMMSFENERGLATTVQNILMNTDIVLIMDETLTAEDMAYFRPGQFVISYIVNDHLNKDSLRSCGVKEFIKLEETGSAVLFPGMIKGLFLSGIKNFNDETLMKMSDMILKIMGDTYALPDIFSEIHDKIADMIVKS